MNKNWVLIIGTALLASVFTYGAAYVDFLLNQDYLRSLIDHGIVLRWQDAWLYAYGTIQPWTIWLHVGIFIVLTILGYKWDD